MEKTWMVLQRARKRIRNIVLSIRYFHAETRLIFWKILLVLRVLHKIRKKWEG